MLLVRVGGRFALDLGEGFFDLAVGLFAPMAKIFASQPLAGEDLPLGQFEAIAAEG